MSQVTATSRTPRIKNPAAHVPGSTEAVQALVKSIQGAGAPPAVLELVHLRASQVNGCSFCVNLAWQGAEKAGGADERLFMVSAWREAPNFTDAERAEPSVRQCSTGDFALVKSKAVASVSARTARSAATRALS